MRAALAVLLVLAAVAAGAAAVAGSFSSDARTAPSPSLTRTPTEEGACPDARPAGRLAVVRVARALPREIPRAYAGMTAQSDREAWRDYAIVAVFSLDPVRERNAWPRRTVGLYRRAAAALCGRAVANRSWVALVHFPRAIGALQAEGIAFVARTPDGWRIWATTVASELPRADLVG